MKKDRERKDAWDMSLNSTPRGERVHIALFGKRNVGKSSILNAVTNQELSVVSSIKGTTTDPVYKSMELLPIGPVVFIDTPGLDDSGSVGDLRILKSLQVLNKTDMAILVIDGTTGWTEFEDELMRQITARKIPCILAVNKLDLLGFSGADGLKKQNAYLEVLKSHFQGRILFISAEEDNGIEELKEELIKVTAKEDNRQLVGDLLCEDDLVLLVVPIDKAAPKGRLILPQQQTIRDILDSNAVSIVVKESKLKDALAVLNQKPRMVITDSQVFEQVDKVVPSDIPLTSFSILFARYKGDLKTLVQGVNAIKNLKDGDRILISEGCTHHKQCDDIGTVKLPKWILENTGKKLNIEYSSGTEFPSDLSGYTMVIHCGGCMLNQKEMQHRILEAARQGIPMTNYGMLIAYLKGILTRSLELFPDISAVIKKNEDI